MLPAPALPGMTENVPVSIEPVHADVGAAGPPAASASAASAAAPRTQCGRASTAAL